MRLPESVSCPVRVMALQSPDSIALASSAGTLTYRELDDAVGAATRNLREKSLDGGRIGVYMEKSAEEVALILALLRAGCVAVMVPTRTPPAEAPKFLKRAGCSALISDMLDADSPDISSPDIPNFSSEALLHGKCEAEDEDVEIHLSQPATVVFTSGSTGTPKAALHTFGNHYASALGSARNIPLEAGDVWLHSLPLFHVGGLSILFRCAVAGATIALPEPKENIAEAIRKSGVTHVSLVATQLRRLLDEDEDLTGVKAILLGGSGIPEDLLDRAHAAGLPIHTSYGLTEMASQVSTTAPNASREELRTSGKTLPGRELRISETGEILVRGDTLFGGYVEGEEISSPCDADGWFHTRDTGIFDESGLLTVNGRLDNQFISGGENIQPEEVEDALRRIAGVEDAVVVPVSDEEFGERPVAFVKGEIPGDVAGELRRTLPGYKVPVAFHGWPEDAPAGMKTDRGFFRRKVESEGR